VNIARPTVVRLAVLIMNALIHVWSTIARAVPLLK
jgi:hypothetical protein